MAMLANLPIGPWLHDLPLGVRLRVCPLDTAIHESSRHRAARDAERITGERMEAGSDAMRKGGRNMDMNKDQRGPSHQIVKQPYGQIFLVQPPQLPVIGQDAIGFGR